MANARKVWKGIAPEITMLLDEQNHADNPVQFSFLVGGEIGF